MLKKIYRLPAGQKLQNSKYLKTPNFILRVSSNSLTNSRFGFLAGKRIDKRAVVRNRVRRVFRSCIEEMIERIEAGYDMLFSLEKGIIDKKRSEAYIELEKFLTERKLLK